MLEPLVVFQDACVMLYLSHTGSEKSRSFGLELEWNQPSEQDW